MTAITHHISDALLRDYADGRLSHAFSVAIAAHISLCDECRAQIEATDMLGGAVLDGLDQAPVGADLRARMMDALDLPPPVGRLEQIRSSGIFPEPVMRELGGNPPKWSMLGGGIRQQILSADEGGSLRLLYIPPGAAVPEHGHGGLELTLVLQGSFSDVLGRFGRGDVEVAHDDVDHQPIADPGQPCICLAATDAPLRFFSFLPRLLQPLFRI
ncbi:ChrR family anti-sigma-E factor [Ketogulonicigenium vulgare]|uniref:Anti-ECFsigma factor, ChrR n=1 Tax=Ketogulonicigenium vulgare (strain WSH-001) TaxID=759362 RepID=F9Y6H4_KETVW|nr:ChrR family anti-sigma-E factor [Ketogulonicigenium vulgare]ADO42730.1 transcriptional activator, putative [Ketogulonicigenium vulgare Y25]AEM40920.1 Anti-ECFsigma factor, ChrR [Ketogulonicigenium vulgare WSH-001]ALJ81074.1 transcriptional regulator [Ketogulonicigenium vulgare]ANW33829.1 transcriptional regulator [Ketogulonicigenium vulgare]AOZ54642.1 transcriptional activator [Ketogulonicigenium vulgare]